MRLLVVAALGMGLAQPAAAQTLNDVGRLLQNQVLGNPANPDRERNAYEQGRRDQEQARRAEEHRRQEARQAEEARRWRESQQHQRGQGHDRPVWTEGERHRQLDRQRAERQHRWADERRARTESGQH